MKPFVLSIILLSLTATVSARGESATTQGGNSMSLTEHVRAIAPALENYAERVVTG